MKSRATKYTSQFLLYLAKTEVGNASEKPESAVTALILAALFIEGFFNDIVEFVKMMDDQNQPDELAAFVDICSDFEKRRQPFLTKLKAGHFILSHKRLDIGVQPFQDLGLLMDLRNALVHKRPESATVELESNSKSDYPELDCLIDRLVHRSVIARPVGRDAPFFVEHLKDRAIAEWAIKTVKDVARKLVDALPESNTASAVERTLLFPVIQEEFYGNS